MPYFKLIHIMLSILLAISTPYASASNSAGNVTTTVAPISPDNVSFNFSDNDFSLAGTLSGGNDIQVEYREIKADSMEELKQETIAIMEDGHIEIVDVDKRHIVDRVFTNLNESIRKEYTAFGRKFTVSDYNITLGLVRFVGIAAVMTYGFQSAHPDKLLQGVAVSIPFATSSGAFQLHSNFIAHWSYQRGHTYKFLRHGEVPAELEDKVPFNLLKDFKGFEEGILKDLEEKGITGLEAEYALDKKLKSRAFLAKYIAIESVLLPALILLTQFTGLADPLASPELVDNLSGTFGDTGANVLANTWGFTKEITLLMASAIGTQFVWENIFYSWHDEKKEGNEGHVTPKMEMTVALQMFLLSLYFNGSAALSQAAGSDAMGYILLGSATAAGVAYEMSRTGRKILKKATEAPKEIESKAVRGTRSVLNSCANFLGKMLPKERILEDVRFQQHIQDMAN